MFESLLHNLIARLPARFLDVAGSNVTFLAGSGRSGTTWVQNIINYRTDYRLLFEPFWAARVPVCAPFAGRQYLRPSNHDPTFERAARHIVRGRFRNVWTDQFTHWGRIYRWRLIKDIRANLFLYWLHRRLPRMPIVLLMRHPVAVVESQLRMGWQYEIAPFFQADDLVTDFLAPFQGIEHECRDAFDRNLVFWCIENYVPLQQFEPGKLHLVFYEELVCDPEAEIRRLFDFLGKRYRADALERITEPSQMTHEASSVRAGDDAVRSWTGRVSGDRLKRSLELLSAFGLAKIYGEDPMPDSREAARMLTRNAGT